MTLRCVTVLLPCAQTPGKSLEHSDESLATIAEQRQRAWKTRLVFEKAGIHFKVGKNVKQVLLSLCGSRASISLCDLRGERRIR